MQRRDMSLLGSASSEEMSGQSFLRTLMDSMYDIGLDMSKYKNIIDKPDLMPKNEQPRNEKCNCGSGLKYKKCCGKRLEG